MKKRLAIFASGTGSNAINFIEYFKDSETVQIALILSNKAQAPVLEKAQAKGVSTVVVSNQQAANGSHMCQVMADHRIDFIVLAGYLRLIPTELIKSFEERMVNIHPSLLPLYGGKGMYGSKVHEAVIANGDTQSGISIHFVNEIYDQGERLFQYPVKVEADDTPDSLAAKIHKLEHAYFPKSVEWLLEKSS